MKTEIPEQPAAPDYSNATKEGIYTDFETLPARRQMEAAARMGSLVSYVDPRTGETKTADFRGEEDWNEYFNRPEVSKWYKEARARGEFEGASKEEFAKSYYENIGKLNGDEVSRMNSGSDAELQRIATKSALDANEKLQRQQLALREELGVKNAEQTRKELLATDPEGFKARESLVSKLRSDVDSAPSDIKTNQANAELAKRLGTITDEAPKFDAVKFGKLEGQLDGLSNTGRLTQIGQRIGDIYNAKGMADIGSRISSADSGRLGDLYSEADRRMTGENADDTKGAREKLMQLALADADRGAKLDDITRNETIQATRAAMAARGNFLGNSAAVAESMELGHEGEKRRLDALNRLANFEGQAFAEGQTAQANSRSAYAQRLGALQGLDDAQYSRNMNAAQALAALEQSKFSQQSSQMQQLAALEAQDYGQKLGTLQAGSSLQGQEFGQRQAAWNNQLQGVQAQGMATNAQAAEDRATRQENYGRDQQKLANISSMILGQPISNQFGNLGAAQQGAVGFNQVGFKGGVGIDPNAGANSANFNQQNYSQAVNMWNTKANIAQQDNAGMMSMISGVGGMAAGAMM